MRRILIGILTATWLLSALPADARAGRSRSISSWGGASYAPNRPYSAILRSPYRAYRRRNPASSFGRSLARAAVQGAAAGAAAGVVGGVVSGAMHGSRHHAPHYSGGYGQGYEQPAYAPPGYGPEYGQSAYGPPGYPPQAPRSDGFTMFLMMLITAGGIFWFASRTRSYR
jgi:hypothetical protein